MMIMASLCLTVEDECKWWWCVCMCGWVGGMMKCLYQKYTYM
jgi:hypothetical protein